MEYSQEFYGGVIGFAPNGGDILDQSAVTQPLIDEGGAGLANMGNGPAFAWVGFVLLLVLLRLLIEVAEDAS